MLKKYEYEEFLNMVKKDLENQEKVAPLSLDFLDLEVAPPVKELKIVDAIYRFLTPCFNEFTDVLIKLSEKPEYYISVWDRSYKQIKAIFPDLSMAQIRSTVRYVRTKFIYDEIEKIRSNEGGRCDYCVYSDEEEDFASEEWCPRIFLQQTWVEEDDDVFYFRILPSAAGFFSCQVNEEDVFPKKVSLEPLTFHDVRTLSGLTQKEFAEKYNIPQRSVENWDAGSRNPPDYLVELLARVVKEDFA